MIIAQFFERAFLMILTIKNQRFVKQLPGAKVIIDGKRSKLKDANLANYLNLIRVTTYLFRSNVSLSVSIFSSSYFFVVLSFAFLA